MRRCVLVEKLKKNSKMQQVPVLWVWLFSPLKGTTSYSKTAKYLWGVSWQLAAFNNPDFIGPLFGPTDTFLYKTITQADVRGALEVNMIQKSQLVLLH